MSDYNVDTLENKIVVEAQEAIKNIQQIIGYGNKLKETINSIGNASGLKNLNNDAKKATSSLTKMQLISRGLKSALNFSGLIYGAKRAYGFLKNSAEASIDYIETLNLFEVSMGKTLDQYGNLDTVSSKYYTRALKFQNELNEKLGTNMEETMRYQALYNQMAESMGINDDASYIISENLTKLGIDLASLFNRTEKDTMEALRAGVLAGQTKPLRNYGLDVTQQTLAPLASELGIERSVKQLSQAEKMILRYIAVLRQASSAHGDFASTIESPANQLKVFKQQFIELKTAIGNLFQGMLGQILPYINAVLMVIKELIKAVANLFGFKMESSNTNLAQKTGVDDLNTGLGSAIGKAKELKAQLMGFDEINNITTDTGSGGSSGGGVSSTGIDSKLLNAMKEYDNLMSKVKMKATDIRDKIMDWLGFTKIINPLTGEVSWKLRDGWTNLRKIWTIIKGLIGLYLITKVIKLIGNLTKLWNILKTTTTSTSAFATGWKTIVGIFKNVGTSIGSTFTYFKYYKSLGATTGQAFLEASKQGLGLLNTSTKLIGGLAGLGASLYGSYDAMRDYSEGTKTAWEATGQLAISIGGATASGALIGSVFGPAGTAVGATAGAVTSLITALWGYESEEEKLKELSKQHREERQKLIDTFEAQKEMVQESLNQDLAQIEYTENLVKELDNLVDSSGNVKKGYEDRVSYILNEVNSAYGTELQLINGQIQGYKEFRQSINDVIETKKAEILLNANEALYAEALKLEGELIKQKENALNDLNSAHELYDEKISSNTTKMQELQEQISATTDTTRIRTLSAEWSTLNQETERYKNEINGYQKEYDDACQALVNNMKQTISYSNLQTAIVSGNSQEIEESCQKLMDAFDEETEASESSWKAKLENSQLYSDLIVETMGKTREELTAEEKELANQRLKITMDSMNEQLHTVEDLTPDVVDAYKYLGEQQYDVYEEQLNKLDPAIKQELQKMTGIIVEKTPEVERVTSEMSEKMLNQLDNNSEMKKQAVESVKAYLQGLSEKDQRKLLEQAGIKNADQVIKGLKEGNLAEDVGINIIQGLKRGLENNYWQGRTLSTAFSFASNVLRRFKSTFGIQSPSKKTKQYGIYLLEGLGIGINNGEKDVLKSVSSFSKDVLDAFAVPVDFIKNGISVNQNRLAVDTNQFIDYGTVKGSINSNLNLNSNLSQIPDLVYNAVMQGMKNSNIQVDIKAETEEGVIVKKASQGFKDYVNQTGELPFPIPV